MLVVQLVEELIALGQGILGHFVQGTAGSFTALTDYEWELTGFSQYSLSTKGNYLAGAVADIAVYGAILLDWIVQGLINTGMNANVAPT